MDVGEWQRRLEEAFSEDNVVGGRYLMDILDAEKKYSSQVLPKLHGYSVLSDSFF